MRRVGRDLSEGKNWEKRRRSELMSSSEIEMNMCSAAGNTQTTCVKCRSQERKEKKSQNIFNHHTSTVDQKWRKIGSRGANAPHGGVKTEASQHIFNVIFHTFGGFQIFEIDMCAKIYSVEIFSRWSIKINSVMLKDLSIPTCIRIAEISFYSTYLDNW